MLSYGLHNSFGFDFDPGSGNLWLEQNGDDTFTELNLVEPGMNGGWIQVMGPIARIDQFKLIETTMFGGNLQQSRVAADEHRRLARGGAGADGDATGRALQRPGVKLES